MLRFAPTKAAMLLVAALAGTACEKTPEPAPSAPALTPPASTPGPAAARPPATPSGPSDVAYDAPAGWQKVDHPSPMRKATYKISRAEGDSEDAEMSVTQAGGNVSMNVDRWVGQFQDRGPGSDKRTEKKVGDLEVTIVEVRGTFTGMAMPGAAPVPPKPSYALLGAIVKTTPNSTFFKLTGPEKTVMAAKADFDKLVDGLRAK